MLPADDRRLYGESYLADTLAVRLGGRAAERLVRGEASTGAADDLASATGLATQMVTRVRPQPGDRAGQLQRPAGQLPALAPPATPSRPNGSWTEEVAALLTNAETRARELLTRHIEALTPAHHRPA